MTKISKQKIYFIPLYYYLSIPDFEKILTIFNTSPLGKTYDIKVLNIQNEKNLLNLNTQIETTLSDHLYETAPFIVKQKNMNYIDNKLDFINFYWKKIKQNIRNSKLLKTFKKNILDNDLIFNILISPYHLFMLLLKKNLYKEIFDFLKYENPATIIVSSDLANINIRFMLLAAHTLKIPILIYWMGDIENKKESSEKTYLQRFKKYSYKRAVYFNEIHNNIIGMYANDATIFVSNSIAKQKLINADIQSDRIKIITPNRQTIQSLSNDPYELSQTKFIVFYTENLKSIYGEDYLVQLHTFLAKLFSELHNQYGVQCIVRPHPMERKGNLYEKFIQQPFNQTGVIIDSILPLDYLMQNSFVNIAHFSKVLLDAVLVENNILSINIQECSRTFIPVNSYHLLEVRTMDDIRKVLTNLLSDKEFFIKFKKENMQLKEQLLKGAEPFEIAFRHLIDKKVT